MEFPRFPDWLVYGAVSLAIVGGALSRREHADPAPAPAPPPGAESVPLGPDSPFDPVSVVRAGPGGDARGAAFGVSDRGLWLTARSNLEACARPALKVAEGRAVRARRIRAGDSHIAVLATPGGPPGLAIGSTGIGARSYAPGFAARGPGEAAAVLVGEANLPRRTRAEEAYRGLVWAQTGRTQQMGPVNDGLIGAPLIDADRRVVGLVTGFDPRRGRILSAPPASIAQALERALTSPAQALVGEPVTPDNYGLAADALRREGQVAQVICLAR